MQQLAFVSCSEYDDFPAPVISDLEVELDNSQVGYLGSDLHIDADIVAEGRIDRIMINIHYEEDHHHDEKSGKNGDHDDHGWGLIALTSIITLITTATALIMTNVNRIRLKTLPMACFFLLRPTRYLMVR